MAPAVPEPEGYRMQPYRAPVPATLAGATVVGLDEVEALRDGGEAILVDVMFRPEKPAGLKEGTLWRQPPREHIPGSVWLPNTGYGALSEEAEGYFRDSLERLTGGDRTRPLVVYCKAECWMSWNAAKRAVSYGYEAVHWFPEGTDAWQAAGLPLAPAEPYAATDATN
jgi:PQQ-dependent catabolism-associated CXXCW motif protein